MHIATPLLEVPSIAIRKWTTCWARMPNSINPIKLYKSQEVPSTSPSKYMQKRSFKLLVKKCWKPIRH